MTLLEGEHISTDVAVRQGQVHWWRHTLGTPAARGTFEHWTIEARARPQLEAYLGGWIGRHLAGYYRHAQPRDDRLDGSSMRTCASPISGPTCTDAAGWMPWSGCTRAAAGSSPTVSAATATVSCSSGRTSASTATRPRSWWRRCAACPHVASVQITFHEDRPAAMHAMPPGGFRLAIVNCLELAAGRAARATLAEFFGV